MSCNSATVWLYYESKAAGMLMAMLFLCARLHTRVQDWGHKEFLSSDKHGAARRHLWCK